VSCACGSGEVFEACCGPRLSGARPAQTPEVLMRSRYTAFVRGDGAYLFATQAPGIGTADDLAQARGRTWCGLTVLDAKGDEVEFEARFLEGGALHLLHERSVFARVDGRWRYERGNASVGSAAVGRNDRCPCGSGKKFKSCHG